jgi:protein-S-isoprenylcysteine O-methyltransferase Ste14
MTERDGYKMHWNFSTFDDDGRKQEPKPSRDWWVPAFVVALIVVPGLASWLIAKLLDANLSPDRIAAWVAGFLALAALFALREYTWRIERQERIGYEGELRRELARERRANLRQQIIIDDLVADDGAA